MTIKKPIPRPDLAAKSSPLSTGIDTDETKLAISNAKERGIILLVKFMMLVKHVNRDRVLG